MEQFRLGSETESRGVEGEKAETQPRTAGRPPRLGEAPGPDSEPDRETRKETYTAAQRAVYFKFIGGPPPACPSAVDRPPLAGLGR